MARKTLGLRDSRTAYCAIWKFMRRFFAFPDLRCGRLRKSAGCGVPAPQLPRKDAFAMRRRWLLKWVSDWVSIFFGIMFSIVFILVIGVFVFAAVRMLRTWNKNNRSPASDRAGPGRGEADGGVAPPSSRTPDRMPASARPPFTRYYATFEFESGDRMEFAVDASNTVCWRRETLGGCAFRGRDSSPLSGISELCGPPSCEGEGGRRRRKNVCGRIRISCGFCRPAKPEPASMEGAQE